MMDNCNCYGAKILFAGESAYNTWPSALSNYLAGDQTVSTSWTYEFDWTNADLANFPNKTYACSTKSLTSECNKNGKFSSEEDVICYAEKERNLFIFKYNSTDKIEETFSNPLSVTLHDGTEIEMSDFKIHTPCINGWDSFPTI